jgi:thiosulfate dehydrogenase
VRSKRVQPGVGLAILLVGAVSALVAWTDPAGGTIPVGHRPELQGPGATPNPLDPDAPAPDQVGPASSPATQRPVSIALGLAIADDTPRYASEYIGGTLSCSSCHIDAGRRGDAWPWLGVASRYPEYDARAGRQISLADRIRECFVRSENGTAPLDGDPVLQSLIEYITSLAATTTNHPPGTAYEDTIPAASRIPIVQLQLGVSEEPYARRCAMCHGPQGEGIGDIPPLWGAHSYNDGAGAARVYTLAGFIRATMPRDAPGTLSDAEAQQLAAFIDTQPRPAYAGKAQDYPDGPVPVDAVYYPPRPSQAPPTR